jgi:hypothetical protein
MMLWNATCVSDHHLDVMLYVGERWGGTLCRNEVAVKGMYRGISFLPMQPPPIKLHCIGCEQSRSDGAF